MDKIIRVGIAGQGRSGHGIHASFFAKDDRFKVVAVADELPERREDAVKMFGCEVFSNYEEMFARGPEIDLFVNATPSRFHTAANLAAMGHTKYLVSEKPCAPTVAEFDQVKAAAEAAGVIWCPFQNTRFNLYFKKIQEILASGVLGEIIYIRLNWGGFGRRWDWQTRLDQMAGNLFNTGPHPVDLAVVLFGEEYPTVNAKFVASHWDFPGDADNFALINLKGPGRPTIDIDVSNFEAYKIGDLINISGTCGGLVANYGKVQWKYFDPKLAPKHEFWKPWSLDRGYCSEQLDWVEEVYDYTNDRSDAEEYHLIIKRFYDNVLDVINGRAERIVTLDQVRRQVYVMEEAHKQNPLPAKPLN